jgi:hypothetical protein
MGVMRWLQVLDTEADNADVMLTGLVLMRYLAQRQSNQKVSKKK